MHGLDARPVPTLFRRPLNGGVASAVLSDYRDEYCRPSKLFSFQGQLEDYTPCDSISRYGSTIL